MNQLFMDPLCGFIAQIPMDQHCWMKHHVWRRSFGSNFQTFSITSLTLCRRQRQSFHILIIRIVNIHWLLWPLTHWAITICDIWNSSYKIILCASRKVIEDTIIAKSSYWRNHHWQIHQVQAVFHSEICIVARVEKIIHCSSHWKGHHC